MRFLPRHGAVRTGFRAVRRSKRIVALVALTDLLVALPAAIYVGMSVHSAAAHRTDATQVARELDVDFFAELRASAAYDATLALMIMGSLLLFFVLRPLVYGGYVGIASLRGERMRFDDFVRDGGGVYWKFLRLSVLGMACAYLLSLGAKPLLVYIDEQAATFDVEGPAERYRRITECVVLGAYWLLGTVIDYARVGVRLHRRPGVVAEFVRSFVFVVQHPLSTLGFSALALLLEVGVIWGVSHALAAADGAYVLTSVVVLLLVQVCVGLREATRLFHLSGAWRIREDEEFGTLPERERAARPRDDLLDNLPWN